MGNIFNTPLIGVILCQSEAGGHPIQTVHNKYLQAIFLAGGVPLALPHGLIDFPRALDNSLARLDGILLTGSPSNIEPHHYGQPDREPHADPGRDRLALALVNACAARQMPLFAICRGLQEMVVACGGTLLREVHATFGYQDHRENPAAPLADQYAPSHDLWLEPHGLLAQLCGEARRWQVNSLHQQGIDSPGPRLRIEARAGDGLIEAVSLPDQPFALGVQWHPEWHSDADPLSQRLFAAFITASQHYQQARYAAG
ncbi:gamma-glutamyl-gamma-aminobutyrate hydrolase [Pantoea sp. 1.19]|uniref:gamma-glutamyl-gamma-aminobutyrate hydrolase n=1 Tax=Pantoea sp. 1.19 TaxID=1925589 RepID=UPI000948B4AB|nr:gamma-glutamyl-gamma-aminobutyrate hydrolase [Pantoea sp. 1.19]